MYTALQRLPEERPTTRYPWRRSPTAQIYAIKDKIVWQGPLPWQ